MRTLLLSLVTLVSMALTADTADAYWHRRGWGAYSTPYYSGYSYTTPYYGGYSSGYSPYYGGYTTPYYSGYSTPYYGYSNSYSSPYYGSGYYARPGIGISIGSGGYYPFSGGYYGGGNRYFRW